VPDYEPGLVCLLDIYPALQRLFGSPTTSHLSNVNEPTPLCFARYSGWLFQQQCLSEESAAEYTGLRVLVNNEIVSTYRYQCCEEAHPRNNRFI
jgi:hypothetical protein